MSSKARYKATGSLTIWLDRDMQWCALVNGQSLAVINTLGLDPSKVNPMGGAIALGRASRRVAW